jgi:uridine kinase
MPARAILLQYVARQIANINLDRPVIGIDGVDGSGKTTFADELAEILARNGRSVIRASVDGFHNPRNVRYRRGKDDPEGYFLDSYDYDKLKMYLTTPFRNGEKFVETARFDHKTNLDITSARLEAPAKSILLIDGIFLHRDELVALWDQSVFLEAPFEKTFARMALRDGMDSDPQAEANRRYLEGQKLYLQRCKPRERATYLIDNSDLETPALLTLDNA